MLDLQALLDGKSAQWQRERAETQLTLGALIAALEAMPADAEVANLGRLHSYRGYYCDLALRPNYDSPALRPASELLAECKAAMGQVFKGYKGGDYVMGALTPMWISHYGESSGTKLLAIHAGGKLETAQEV